MIRLNAPAPTIRRISSWGWDYLLIVGWLLLVFLVIGLPQILGWIDLTPVWTEQTSADVGITLLTVLPYFAYLFLTELKKPHATWGKRKARLAEAGSVSLSDGTGLRSQLPPSLESLLTPAPKGSEPITRVWVGLIPACD